jgi:hypothetical protein
MPRRRRLTNTAATLARSSSRPVSFSTIEAMISASSASASGRSGARASHACVELALHAIIGEFEDPAVAGTGVKAVGVGEELTFRGLPSCPSARMSSSSDKPRS